MDRRGLVEFITAIILVIIGSITTLVPIFGVTSISSVFAIVIVLYGIIHFIKNCLILTAKEYSGFSTTIACIITLIILYFVDVNDNPLRLALILFIWIIMMSLIKLKESDYYHDHNNKLWELNIINLILFILSGILATINLYCTSDVQILVLGFFFLINGILDLMDPFAGYLIDKSSKGKK